MSNHLYGDIGCEVQNLYHLEKFCHDPNPTLCGLGCDRLIAEATKGPILVLTENANTLANLRFRTHVLKYGTLLITKQ